MANEVFEVEGSAARDAILAASGSVVISVEQVGGFQTFGSGSVLTGFPSGANTPVTKSYGPIDAVVWRIVVGS